MGFFDYFTPPTSPVQGPNKSQFGKDFAGAVESGAHQLGNLVSRGLLNFGNFVSGGKLAQQQPQSFGQQPSPSPRPSAAPSPMPSAMPKASPTPSPMTAQQQGPSPWGNALAQATKAFQRPTATPTPTTLPTATPTPAYSPRQMQIDALQQGFKNWGSPPAATLAGTMVDESQKYPILQQHPELLAVLTLLESGGMKNMPQRQNSEFRGEVSNENRQFNGYGWGLNPQFGFNPGSPQEVIQKVAQGISTKPQYAAFRNSGDIKDLAQVYSPYNAVTNPHGGDRYVNNYNQIADVFKAAEAEIKRRRGIK